MMTSTTILALDGVFDTGLAAIQDTLATARDLAPPGSNNAWKAQVFSIRRVAHTAHGLMYPYCLYASSAFLFARAPMQRIIKK
jgi:hypothetical protein